MSDPKSQSAKNKSRSAIMDSVFGEEDDSGGLDYAGMFTSGQKKAAVLPMEYKDINIYEIIESPPEWNFYSKLPDDVMQEMIESIVNIGLQNPIILWEQNDGRFMVLSGHNRLRAYRMIYESTKESQYEEIPSLIYKNDQLTDNMAKEIIVDSNWVQRSLKTVEKAKSILMKIQFITERREEFEIKGRVRDVVAKQYGLKGRMLDNYKMLNDLIEPFTDMVDNSAISIKSGSKLARFPKETQEWIYENYRESLKSKTINMLSTDMSHEEIKEILNANHEAETNVKSKVSVEIPYGMEKEFKELVEQWATEKKIDMKKFHIYIK